MRKIKVWLLAAALLVSVLAGVPMKAEAAGASLSFSKGTLRAGDSFSVTLNVALSGAITVNGSFSYSGPISLTSISGNTGSLDVNGTNIFVDLNTTSGVSGTQAIATANFTVSGSAGTGEAISVSFSGNYSNLNGDYGVSGSNGTTVAAPLSSNCNLSSLSISNATLSPSFSVGKTSYFAGTVEFGVSQLNINAVAEDSKAKVSISGNSLVVGNNTVSVTVKAENGATKTYTISVAREQDPNYVPSSDTSISGITVDGFVISPPFQNGVDKYVVWLPYETTAIATSATPADSKASVSVSGGTDLVEGDNEIVITCTAEDGTTKEYYVIAKRATRDGSAVEKESEKTVKEEPDESDTKKQGVSVLVVVAVGAGAFVLGAGVLFLLYWLQVLPIVTRKKK